MSPEEGVEAAGANTAIKTDYDVNLVAYSRQERVEYVQGALLASVGFDSRVDLAGYVADFLFGEKVGIEAGPDKDEQVVEDVVGVVLAFDVDDGVGGFYAGDERTLLQHFFEIGLGLGWVVGDARLEVFDLGEEGGQAHEVGAAQGGLLAD